jgi:hypothetical protein
MRRSQVSRFLRPICLTGVRAVKIPSPFRARVRARIKMRFIPKQPQKLAFPPEKVTP